MKADLLLVEDDRSHRQMLEEALNDEDYRVYPAASGQDALEIIGSCRPKFALIDIGLPDFDGVQLLGVLRERCPDCLVLLMTGQATVEAAVEAMKKGAYDYLAKPFRMELLLLKLERLLQLKTLQAENRELRQQQGDVVMVGASEPFQRLLEVLANVARTSTTVLIQGETGTGKELAARLLHQQSARRDGPLISVNCGAIPSNLLESELFGYEKGAFTSAQQAHKGLLEQADGGTLFLDEVGEIPLNMQVKLLRALEERVIYRLGSEGVTRVDFRLVAATNRSLDQLRQAGLIREDFFFRLNVVPVVMPPLRDRQDDIPLLVIYLIKLHAGRTGLAPLQMMPEALDVLLRYSWPGNVRELHNLIERLQVLYPGQRVMPEHLPEEIRGTRDGNDFLHGFRTELPLKQALLDFETRFIRRVLAEERGSKTAAAARLGISRKNLWEKLSR